MKHMLRRLFAPFIGHPLFCGAFLIALFLSVAAASAANGGPHLGLVKGKTLSGRFVHEHPIQGFDKPMRTEGRFSIAPGSKMLWVIEKPMQTTTTVSQGTLVQSVGEFPLLKLTPQQMPFLADVEDKLLAGLNGKWSEVEKDYIVSRKAIERGWVVILIPKPTGTGGQPFQKIVARGDAFPEKVEIILKDGTTDTVQFSNQRLD